MEVDISCHRHGLPDTPGCQQDGDRQRTLTECRRNIAQEKPARLLVRSQVRDWIDSGLKTPPDSSKSGYSSKASRKRRKVRFMKAAEDNPPDTHDAGPCSPSSDLKLDSFPNNLCSEDLCSVLYKSPCSVPSKLDHAAACLGYINVGSEETFQHYFYGYLAAKDEQNLLQSVVTPRCLMSMNDILSHQAETSLSIV
jgi:hypothetical protein